MQINWCGNIFSHQFPHETGLFPHEYTSFQHTNALLQEVDDIIYYLCTHLFSKDFLAYVASS